MKILLVDDHMIFAESLRTMLAAQAEVDLSTRGLDALNQLDSGDYDLMLLDIQLPDIDGFSLLSLINKRELSPPVLMLSGSDDRQVVERARQCGAAGFCHKSSSPENLERAIKAITGGKKWWVGSSAAPGEADCGEDAALRVAEKLGITSRQLEVLRLLDQGLGNKEVAERMCISPSTVKTHLYLIFQSLGAPTRTACLHTARQLGLLSRK